MEQFITITEPFGISASAFCTVKSVPFHVDAERLVEVGFGDLPERRELAEAGVGKEMISTRPFCSLTVAYNRSEICQIRYVTLNTGDVFSICFTAASSSL